MVRREELQEAQWALVEPLLPKPPRRADGRGRPRNSAPKPPRCPLRGLLRPNPYSDPELNILRPGDRFTRDSFSRALLPSARQSLIFRHSASAVPPAASDKDRRVKLGRG